MISLRLVLKKRKENEIVRGTGQKNLVLETYFIT
jgi:hypothetical protein